MINPDAELNRLRWRLQDAGLSYNYIDSIVGNASKDINETILEIVSAAIEQATDYAQEIGANEFINEIDIKEVGGFFQVSTISGRMDFSTPERQMLPDLLKGAKENPKTGIKTKVIPIKGDNITMPSDVFSAMQGKQRRTQQARQTLLENSGSNRTTVMTSHLRSTINREGIIAKTERKVSDSNSLNMKFRTAASSQDPSTTWIYPAKELDLSGFLLNLNKTMQDTLADTVPRLIDSYIEEYT